MSQSQFSNASNRRWKKRELRREGRWRREPERDVGDGEWRRDKLDRAETVVCNKIPTVFLLDRQSWEGAQADRLVWPGSSTAATDIISSLRAGHHQGAMSPGMTATGPFFTLLFLFSLLLIWISVTVWHLSQTYFKVFSAKICNSYLSKLFKAQWKPDSSPDLTTEWNMSGCFRDWNRTLSSFHPILR